MPENAGKRFYSANFLLDSTVTAKIKSTTRIGLYCFVSMADPTWVSSEKPFKEIASFLE